MRTNILLFLLIIYCTAGKAQGYENNFKNDICDCITPKIKNNEGNVANLLNTCFIEVLPKYASTIDAQIKEEDKQMKFALGQQKRTELNLKFKYELIASCDAYYAKVHENREAQYDALARRSDSTTLKKANEQVAMYPMGVSYYTRGTIYLGMGKYDKAIADFKHALETGQLDREANKSLAMTYEKMGNYTKAIAIYDAIEIEKYDMEVRLLRELAKRGGKVPNAFKTSSQTTGAPPTATNAENRDTVLRTRNPSGISTNTVSTRRSRKTQQSMAPGDSTRTDNDKLRSLFKLKKDN